MDVDWHVFIAIKEKPETVLFEDPGHENMLESTRELTSQFSVGRTMIIPTQRRYNQM